MYNVALHFAVLIMYFGYWERFLPGCLNISVVYGYLLFGWKQVPLLNASGEMVCKMFQAYIGLKRAGILKFLGRYIEHMWSLIARFMGPTWGPSGADRTQVGPMLAPWTLLSGMVHNYEGRLGINWIQSYGRRTCSLCVSMDTQDDFLQIVHLK